MAFLEVYFPDGRVEHFELGKSVMNIGRSSQADIAIELPGISRIHARIEKGVKGRWMITDLDSRNKTYVNSQAVKTHVLSNRDVFYFGSIKVVFQDPTGDSDEKADQTVPRKKKRDRDKSENVCPLCKTQMPDHAVVCMSCGYNVKLGKRMKLQVDEGAEGKNSDTNHTPFDITAKIKDKSEDESESEDNSIAQSPMQFIRDWILPPALIVISVVVILVTGHKEGLIAQAILIPAQAALVLLGAMIAQRIADLEFSSFGLLLLKCFAVAAVLGCLDSWARVSQWGFLMNHGLPLLILFPLVLLVFEIDGYGAMVIVLFMGILRNTLLLYLAQIAYHIGSGGEMISGPAPTPTPADALPIDPGIIL